MGVEERREIERKKKRDACDEERDGDKRIPKK